MPSAPASLSEQQDKSQKGEQKYALKGRGQQGGVDLYGRADITVSLQHSACRKQMAKKWWKGLLGLWAGFVLLPMLPLGTYMVCFENWEWELCCQSCIGYFTAH